MKLTSLLLVLAFPACFIPGARAQSLSNVYTFSALNNFTNADGATPYAGLTLSGNTLYGAAYSGGNSNDGTVFAILTNGTGFTNLHTFTNRSDGAGPDAVLAMSGNFLYGTAASGGDSSEGTVFAINTNGTLLNSLHSFTALSGPFSTNTDGATLAGRTGIGRQ